MMELPKLTVNKLEKYSNLKFNHNFPTRDGLLLKSLQNENLFIKKKLAEFESRLDMYPVATVNDKLKSQSINVNKNDQLIEAPKLRKIKSARPSKHIDALLNSQPTLKELKESDEETTAETPKEFKIPEKTFSRLNSARLNSARTNFSQLSSARPISSRICSARIENELPGFTRLNSATQATTPSRERITSARNVPSNVSTRIASARTVDTVSTVNESTRTTDSALEKIDQVIDHLKKHRRSALRKRTVEENFQRPKTSNTICNRQSAGKEIKPESAKKKSRSKSAKKSAKKDDYQHMFYSNSWRIHSEFMTEDVDRNAVWDNTTSQFYKTSRKIPETFIFSPDWI